MPHLKQLPAKLRLVAGAGVNGGAPGVHEHPAIGLLVITDLDHVNPAIKAEEPAGEREGGAPLARDDLIQAIKDGMSTLLQDGVPESAPPAVCESPGCIGSLSVWPTL